MKVVGVRKERTILKKTIKIGKIKEVAPFTYAEPREVWASVILEIELKEIRDPFIITIDGKKVPKEVRLSICGTIEYHRTFIAGGQIKDTLEKAYKNNTLSLKIPDALFIKILEIWDKWHLNDLRAYCIHQKPIVERHKGKSYDELIKIPELKKCPVCGYRYGSQWRYEPLPEEVIEFIKSL